MHGQFSAEPPVTFPVAVLSVLLEIFPWVHAGTSFILPTAVDTTVVNTNGYVIDACQLNACIICCVTRHHSFAHQNVVKACVIVVSNFHLNSTHTNHCAAKLLHRIAFDHHMVALLFQTRLFRVFARLLCDPVYSTASQFHVITVINK